MKPIIKSVFLLIGILSFNFAISQKNSKTKSYPDMVQNKNLFTKITGNETTADLLEYYGVFGTRDFIRREGFILSYFNADGSKKWDYELDASAKLNISEIKVHVDNEYVYIGMMSSYFGSKDKIVVLNKKGEFLTELKWDFSFKVSEKVGIFGDQSGFKIWVRSDAGKISDYYLITVKGDKMTYVKTNDDSKLKEMISPAVKSKISEDEFNKLKITFQPIAAQNFQFEMYHNLDPNSVKYTKSQIVYVKNKSNSNHIFSVYLEFAIDGKGVITKQKEFVINSDKNGTETIMYNAIKKEYVYILDETREDDKPLISEIRILDADGIEKSKSVVKLSTYIKESGDIKNLSKTTSIVSSGTLDQINTASPGMSYNSNSGVSSVMNVTHFTVNDNNRLKYDPISKNYFSWITTIKKDYLLVFNGNSEVLSFSGIEKNPISTYFKGNMYSWNISAEYGEETVLFGSNKNGVFPFLHNEIELKDRKKTAVTSIPNADGSTWLVLDNSTTAETSLYLIK